MEPTLRLPSRKLVIRILFALLLLAVLWYAFVYKTFVRVEVIDGTDNYSLSSSYSGEQAAKGSSSLVHIRRGSYVVRSYNGSTITGVQLWKTSILPFGGVTTTKADTTSRASEPILGQFADRITQLNDGNYLYLDKRSKAAMLATSTGVSDISGKFNLSTGQFTTYNRVVSILPTKDKHALVVTTKEVYLVRNADERERLNLYDANLVPNFTAASYDAATNSIFLLNSYDKTVYKFDLNNPIAGAAKLYTSDKNIQAISSGGGRIAVYGNNFPTTSSKAIKRYSEKTLTNIIVLSSSGKVISNIDEKNITLALPAQSGDNIAIKKKFSTTLDIYNTTTGERTTIPAYDVSGIAWIGSTLYIGRDNAIWSYNSNAPEAGLQKVADVASGTTSITTNSESLTVATLGNVAQKIPLSAPAGSSSAASDLTALTLRTKTYDVSFTNVNGVLTVNKQTSQNYEGDGSEIDELVRSITAAIPASNYVVTERQILFPGIYKYATINLTSE